jgi:hypothetical protein
MFLPFLTVGHKGVAKGFKNLEARWSMMVCGAGGLGRPVC